MIVCSGVDVGVFREYGAGFVVGVFRVGVSAPGARYWFSGFSECVAHLAPLG